MIVRRKLIPDGVREEFVLVGGHRMRYLTAGSGPPLMFLHGLLGFSFSFSENLAPLAKIATVYAPDFLNTGYSERPKTGATLSDLADQVSNFMAAIGVAKADLLGSSHGGSIAMLLAAKSPEKVGKLILVSPANCWSESGGRLAVTLVSTAFGRMIAPHLGFLSTLGTAFFVRRLYHDFSRALPGTIAGYAAPLRDSQGLNYCVDVARAWRRDFEELKTSMYLLRNVPTLLIWGTHDPVVPLETGKALLSEFRNARLVTLDAGHLPYEELPEEFNRCVTDFLLSTSSKLRTDVSAPQVRP